MKLDWATISVTAYGALLAYALSAQLAGGTAFVDAVRDFQTLIAGAFALVSVLYLARQVKEERLRHVASVRLALRNELEAIEAALEWIELDRLNVPTAGVNSQFNRPLNPLLAQIYPDDFAYLKANIDRRTAQHLQALVDRVSDYNAYVNRPENQMYPEAAATDAKAKADYARDAARLNRHLFLERRVFLNSLME